MNAILSDLLNAEGLRLDGRRANELRQIRCALGKTDLNTNQDLISTDSVDLDWDGCAVLEHGLTKVLAFVRGPREPKYGRGAAVGSLSTPMTSSAPQESDEKSKTTTGDKSSSASKTPSSTISGMHSGGLGVVHVDFAQSAFALTMDRKRRGRMDKRSMEMSILLRKSLETVLMLHLYPRSEIYVHVQVLHADGGVLAACLNACSLAVIDAGLAVRDYICASTAGLVEATPILESSAADLPKFTVAVLPRSGRVLLTHLESRMPLNKFEMVKDLAVSGAREIHDILDQNVRETALRRFQDRQMEGLQ